MYVHNFAIAQNEVLLNMNLHAAPCFLMAIDCDNFNTLVVLT